MLEKSDSLNTTAQPIISHTRDDRFKNISQKYFCLGNNKISIILLNSTRIYDELKVVISLDKYKKIQKKERNFREANPDVRIVRLGQESKGTVLPDRSLMTDTQNEAVTVLKHSEDASQSDCKFSWIVTVLRFLNFALSFTSRVLDSCMLTLWYEIFKKFHFRKIHSFS